MSVKKGKRELINTGTDKRYVKRNTDGTFKELVDVGSYLGQQARERAGSHRLNYELYFNSDNTECLVFERYRDSQALLDHHKNLGDTMAAILQDMLSVWRNMRNA